MKAKISLAYILPVLILLFFSFKSSLSQVEVDTSSNGPPDETLTLDNFKDSLSKSGEWVKIDKSQIDPDSTDQSEQVDTEYVDEDVCTDYVWVPNPALIWIDWNPYCYGHWVWTYWGWEWVPYYDWGWCTYHYGRWWHSDHYGWCWSPGWRWRSHWVSWYHHGNYWGWHPLPPRVYVKDGTKIMPVKKNVKDDGWVFVNKKDFKNPIDRTKIVDPNRHTEIFNSGRRNPQTKNDGTKINTNTGNRNNGTVDKSRGNKSGVTSTKPDTGHRKVIIYRKGNNGTNRSGNNGSYNTGSRGSNHSGNNGSRGSSHGSNNNGSRSNSNSGSRSSSHSNSGSRNK